MPKVKVKRSISYLGSTIRSGEVYDLDQDHIDAFGPEYVEAVESETVTEPEEEKAVEPETVKGRRGRK